MHLFYTPTAAPTLLLNDSFAGGGQESKKKLVFKKFVLLLAHLLFITFNLPLIKHFVGNDKKSKEKERIKRLSITNISHLYGL